MFCFKTVIEVLLLIRIIYIVYRYIKKNLTSSLVYLNNLDFLFVSLYLLPDRSATLVSRSAPVSSAQVRSSNYDGNYAKHSILPRLTLLKYSNSKCDDMKKKSKFFK